MPMQRRNVLKRELHQGCSSRSVKRGAKSPRILLVSTKSKVIWVEREDELRKLFPGFHIRTRNKERRVLPFALDHPSFTVGADVRLPLQRNLIWHYLPFGIGMCGYWNARVLLSQVFRGQDQP